MRKRFLTIFIFALIASTTMLTSTYGFAEEKRRFSVNADLGPASAQRSTLLVTTIAAPGPQERNCLEYISAHSTVQYTLYLLVGNTTNYQLTSGANGIIDKNFIEPFCVEKGMAILVNCNASGQAARVNYKGFVAGNN